MTLNIKQAATVTPFLIGAITVISWDDNGGRFALAVLAGLILSINVVFGFALLIEHRNR